jgi:hypothetical protein
MDPSLVLVKTDTLEMVNGVKVRLSLNLYNIVVANLNFYSYLLSILLISFRVSKPIQAQ